jgi:hypothetical protein
LIRQVIAHPDFSESIQIALILLALKVIAVNLFVITIGYQGEMNGIRSLDLEHFIAIRKLLPEILESPIACDGYLILESVLVVLSVGFRYIYHPSYDDFEALVNAICANDILSQCSLSLLPLLVPSGAVLYSFTDSFFKKVADLPDADLCHLLTASLPRLNLELEFLAKWQIDSNEKFITTYLKHMLGRLGKMGDSNEFLSLGYLLGIELMILEPFPSIARILVDHAVPVLNAVMVAAKSDEPDPTPIKDMHSLLGNICFYAFGNAMKIAIQSYPKFRIEEACRIVFDNGLVSGPPPPIPPEEVIQTHPTPIRTLSGSFRMPSQYVFTRGISFDVVTAEKHNASMRNGFLRDLVAPDATASSHHLPQFFCRAMYQAVRTILKADRVILGVERFAISAFLKQTGYLNTAMSFAMSLSSHPGSRPPVSLQTIWQTIYKIRDKLRFSRQQTIEVADGEKARQVLSDDFDEFCSEVKTKCRFLFDREPIMKEHVQEDQPCSPDVLAEVLKNLCGFILAEYRFDELRDVLQLRMQRLQFRVDSLRSAVDMLRQDLASEFENSMLIPITDTFGIMGDLSDVAGLAPEAINTLIDSFSALFDFLVARIADPGTERLWRCLCLKSLSTSGLAIVSPSSLENAVMRFVEFIGSMSLSESPDLFSTWSALWRLVACWGINHPFPGLAAMLLEIASNESPEMDGSRCNAVLVLASISNSIDIRPEQLA